MRLDRREMLFAGTALLLGGASRSDAAGEQDWMNWRGPHFNGSADATGLPVKFSPTEAIRWAADMPGPSAATPIVCGDHIFVSSTEPAAKQLLAMCLDRKTGAVKWKHSAGTGYRPAGEGNEIQLDGRSNYASPSPVSDGQRVVFFYGNGDMIAYDFEGKKLWSRNLQQDYGDFAFGWTFSTSPQFYGGRLYMQILQRDRPIGPRGRMGAESFLLSLDPATGKEQWRVLRPTQAIMESREAFTTPVPHTHNGRTEILLAGGDMLSGHDPATGKENWRWGTWDEEPEDPSRRYKHPTLRLVPSPVAGAGVVLGCGPKAKPVYAVKLGMSGDISESGLAWRTEFRGNVTTDVATPLFYRDRFYVLSDLKRNLSCLDPKDGKVLWTTATPGRSMCWGSPTGADGKVYAISLMGEVHVFDADKGELLATNPMATDENEIRSSVVVARGDMFVRTNSKLFCIGRS